MDDVISRQAAIDAINQICPIDTEYDCTLLDRVDVRCVLTDLPSAQPEQRWIPCSERLPKVRQWVLCQCRAGIIDVLRLTDDGCWYRKSNEIYMSGFVLAWMPLPEPYKRGEQDEDQEEGS